MVTQVCATALSSTLVSNHGRHGSHSLVITYHLSRQINHTFAWQVTSIHHTTPPTHPHPQTQVNSIVKSPHTHPQTHQPLLLSARAKRIVSDGVAVGDVTTAPLAPGHALPPSSWWPSPYPLGGPGARPPPIPLVAGPPPLLHCTHPRRQSSRPCTATAHFSTRGGDSSTAPSPAAATASVHAHVRKVAVALGTLARPLGGSSPRHVALRTCRPARSSHSHCRTRRRRAARVCR